MKFSFSQATDLSAATIWPYYADVNKWFTWEGDLEQIELAGSFSQGTSGKMKLTDQPPQEFILESVITEREFIDRTPIPEMGAVYFIHRLHPSGNQTIIEHAVEFIPDNRPAKEQDLAFIQGIFADVPESIFALEKAAQSHD